MARTDKVGGAPTAPHIAHPEPARPGPSRQARPAERPAARADDVLASESLRHPLVQALERQLAPQELAAAHAARLLDSDTRAEIFRQRLLNLLPESRSEILALHLDTRHDYTKILHFMDTGSWPDRSAPELPHVFARCLEPLMPPAGRAWQAAVVASAKLDGGPASTFLGQYIERQTHRVWEAVVAARLQGGHTLTLSQLTGIEALPAHLWTLRQLRHLRLSDADLRALPAALGQLGRLESLRLDNMKNLRGLPQAIGQLKKLKLLAFGGERVRDRLRLPRELASLPQLQAIDVGNSDTARPDWLPERVGFIRIRSQSSMSEASLAELGDLDAAGEHDALGSGELGEWDSWRSGGER